MHKYSLTQMSSYQINGHRISQLYSDNPEIKCRFSFDAMTMHDVVATIYNKRHVPALKNVQ